MHVHGARHMQCNNYSNIFLSCRRKILLHALLSVWNILCLLDWSVWTIWWTTLLWRAMHSLFMCWFLHVANRCGHVSISLFVHSVKLLVEWVSGQKVCF